MAKRSTKRSTKRGKRSANKRGKRSTKGGFLGLEWAAEDLAGNVIS